MSDPLLPLATPDALRAHLRVFPDFAGVPHGRRAAPSRSEWEAHCEGRFDRAWCLAILGRHPRLGRVVRVTTHLFFDDLEMTLHMKGAQKALARGDFFSVPVGADGTFVPWPSPEKVEAARAHYARTLALLGACDSDAQEVAS